MFHYRDSVIRMNLLFHEHEVYALQISEYFILNLKYSWYAFPQPLWHRRVTTQGQLLSIVKWK